MSSRISSRGSHRIEVLIGRSLAAAVHPVAAWNSAVPSFRLMLLVSYFVAGYAVILATLALI
jgi:hypothetical protein